MDKEVICEVLSRLIGYTMPCGDKDVDTVRRINNYNLVYVTKQCVAFAAPLCYNADVRSLLGA